MAHQHITAHLGLALALVVVGPALATDYYVRTDGSDTCDGLSNAPAGSGSCAFQSIGMANSVAGCGDTVNIGTGSFPEAEVNLNGSCTSGNEIVFSGSGTENTYWMAGLVDVDESTCVADSRPNVYRCDVPAGFDNSGAGNSRYCFVQRNTDHVHFEDDNGTKGDMTGPVCVTWNTQGASDVSGREGHVYYDAAHGYFYIRPWDDKSPSAADFWAPQDSSFYDGSDGPVDINGDYYALKNMSVLGSAYTTISVQGDYSLLEDLHIYTGMVWYTDTESPILRRVKIMNAYRRPTNGSGLTAWGATGSQTLAMGMSNNYYIEDLESYGAREGCSLGGDGGEINGIVCHGHHNHIFKFQGGAHDIVVRDCLTYNGQEPLFIACAKNLRFENCTFPFYHVTVQGANCPADEPSGLEFHNNAWCGILFHDYGGASWEKGGHKLTNNVYMSDHGNCHQNGWYVQLILDSMPNREFDSLSAWQNWADDPCTDCIRDTGSITDTVANTWVSYSYRDEHVGANIDFDLKASALAIDLGDPAYGDSHDIEGVIRTGRPDAGTYEGPGGGGEPVCGNGMQEAGEECDGFDLAGQTCESRGHSGGILACTSSCTLDESGCTDEPDLPPATPENLDRTDTL